jgi:hypothetical protein
LTSEAEAVSVSGGAPSSDSPLARGVTAAEPLDADMVPPVDGPPSAVAVQELTAEGLLPFEAWLPLFSAVHTLPGHFLALRTLQEAPGRDGHEQAARAIYETIAEVPSLHFLLSPGGKWGERAAAILLYALPLGMAVKGELAERRRPARPKVPANDPVPPPPAADDDLLKSPFFQAAS